MFAKKSLKKHYKSRHFCKDFLTFWQKKQEISGKGIDLKRNIYYYINASGGPRPFINKRVAGDCRLMGQLPDMAG